MSLSFIGSCFDDTASNQRYVLTNNSNQAGTLQVNLIPADNFLLRSLWYLNSNSATPASNWGLSYGDSSNRMNFNFVGSNFNMLLNTSQLVSCNVPRIFNSNYEVSVRTSLSNIKVYVNNSLITNYNGSNLDFNSGWFSLYSSNAPTISNLTTVKYPLVNSIFTIANPMECLSSVRLDGNVFSSNLTACNITAPNLTSLSNYTYGLSTNTTNTTVVSSNISTSNLYLNSYSNPSITASASNSLTVVVGSTNSDYYRLQKIGGVDLYKATSGTTPNHYFAGNVGVGTSNAVYNLDVLGTIRGTSLTTSNIYSSNIYTPLIQCNGGPLYLKSEYTMEYTSDFDGNNGGAGHIFYTASNERMRINNAGCVGIGTNNPYKTLDVWGNYNFMTSNECWVGTSNCYIYQMADNANYARFGAYGTSGFKNLYIQSPVGIGITNPAYQLGVNGTANATTLYENGTLLSSKYTTSSNFSSFSNYVNSNFRLNSGTVDWASITGAPNFDDGSSGGGIGSFFLNGLLSGGVSVATSMAANGITVGGQSIMAWGAQGFQAIQGAGGMVIDGATSQIKNAAETFVLNMASNAIQGLKALKSPSGYDVFKTIGEGANEKTHLLADYFTSGPYSVHIDGGNNRMAVTQSNGQSNWYCGLDSMFHLSNVGVGLSNPTYKLDVGLGDIRIQNGGNVANAGGAIYFQAASNTTTPMAQIKGLLVNMNASNLQEQGGLGFYTRPLLVGGASNASLVQRMIIGESGYIGIGTSTPQYNLDVNGNTRTGALRIGSNGSPSAPSGQDVIHLFQPTVGGYSSNDFTITAGWGGYYDMCGFTWNAYNINNNEYARYNKSNLGWSVLSGGSATSGIAFNCYGAGYIGSNIPQGVAFTPFFIGSNYAQTMNLNVNDYCGMGIASSSNYRLEINNTNTGIGHIKLSGSAYNSNGLTSTEGAMIGLGVNTTVNRQIWFMDSANKTPNTSNVSARITLTGTTAQLDAVSTDNTVLKQITIGNSAGVIMGGNVGIGTNPAYKLDIGTGQADTGTAIRINTGDSDKILMTSNGVNGSKIAHINGWGLNIIAGQSNLATGVINLQTGTASGYVTQVSINGSGLSASNISASNITSGDMTATGTVTSSKLSCGFASVADYATYATNYSQDVFAY